MAPIVIVGSGLAGYGLARELRRIDRETPVTVVTRDAGDYYAKPALSNALASGKSPDALVTTTAADFCAQHGVTLSPRTTVDRIDRERSVLETSGGPIPYSRLVLALGADPIRLAFAGGAASEVVQVNDLDDYRAFRAAIEGRKRIAIVGAGLIGCEFANDLLASGFEVAVIDPAARPLSALLPDAAGLWHAQRLASAGVRWIFGDAVASVDRDSNGHVLGLRSGATIETDAVLSAVGLRPRTSLAGAAGLRVDRGIVVDDFGVTSDASIFALGDCAQFGDRVMPYVAPILTAARAIAATITGTATPIRFPTMPVIVKTPACPVAVVTPPSHAAGEWTSEDAGDGMRMRFVGADATLLGFVLLGSKAAERGQFVRAVGQVVPANT